MGNRATNGESASRFGKAPFCFINSICSLILAETAAQPPWH
jgi:hypothetical protein